MKGCPKTRASLCILGLVTLLTGLPGLPAIAEDFPKLSRADLKSLQQSFADLAEQVRPSVVAIRTYAGEAEASGPRLLRHVSQGSGVVLRAHGYILTNYHVVEEGPHVVVILHDGSQHDAERVQHDARSDLAVLKIKAENLRAADFADLSDARVGHWTLAMGNPFGLSNDDGRMSFSVGNVSAIGRNLSRQLDPTDRRYYGELIETTSSINPGNSGGPLFNVDGRVIGIVTAIETSTGVNEGLGFAIPISTRTRSIIAKLEHGEQVRYGYLGVRVEDLRENRRFPLDGRSVRGARIGEILNGPAARAELQTNDIIVEFDGVPIEGSDHLVRLVGDTPVGTAVTARYLRDGEPRQTTVVLDERDLEAVAASREPDETGVPTLVWRGALLAEMPEAVLREIGLTARDAGLMVIGVRPGSEAAERGLHEDQIIVAVNGERVRSLREFREVRSRQQNRLHLQLHNGREIEFAEP